MALVIGPAEARESPAASKAKPMDPFTLLVLSTLAPSYTGAVALYPLSLWASWMSSNWCPPARLPQTRTPGPTKR